MYHSCIRACFSPVQYQLLEGQQQLSKKTMEKITTRLLTLGEISEMSPWKFHLLSFLEAESIPLYCPVQLYISSCGQTKKFFFYCISWVSEPPRHTLLHWALISLCSAQHGYRTANFWTETLRSEERGNSNLFGDNEVIPASFCPVLLELPTQQAGLPLISPPNIYLPLPGSE